MIKMVKYIAFAIIIFFFVFTLPFCFDSPNTQTNIKLVGENILICGVLLWLINRKWCRHDES